MRVYLNVPYAEKDAAKAAGACWDPRDRRWYVNADRELTRLGRWLPAWHSLHGKVAPIGELAPEHVEPERYSRFSGRQVRDNGYRLKRNRRA